MHTYIHNHSKLFNFFNKKYPSCRVNRLFSPFTKVQCYRMNESVLKRPRELDIMKKQVVDHQGVERHRQSTDSEENIGVYGYFLLVIELDDTSI